MSRFGQMPVIDMGALSLSDEDREIVARIIGRANRLRSSKPKDGESAYVWRMVAFYVSPNPQHSCVPVTADFDLPDIYWRGTEGDASYYARKRAIRRKHLDFIVDAIVNSIPCNRWNGVKRWANVF